MHHRNHFWSTHQVFLSSSTSRPQLMAPPPVQSTDIEKGKEPGRVSFLLLGGRTLSSIPPKVTKVRPPHAAQFAGEAWIDCLWLSKFHLQNFLSVFTKYVFWRLVNFHVTHKARPKKNFPIAAAQANAVQAKSHNYLSKLNFTSYFPHFFFSPTRTAVHILSARARPDPQERELQLSLPIL